MEFFEMKDEEILEEDQLVVIVNTNMIRAFDALKDSTPDGIFIKEIEDEDEDGNPIYGGMVILLNEIEFARSQK